MCILKVSLELERLGCLLGKIILLLTYWLIDLGLVWDLKRRLHNSLHGLILDGVYCFPWCCLLIYSQRRTLVQKLLNNVCFSSLRGSLAGSWLILWFFLNFELVKLDSHIFLRVLLDDVLQDLNEEFDYLQLMKSVFELIVFAVVVVCQIHLNVADTFDLLPLPPHRHTVAQAL